MKSGKKIIHLAQYGPAITGLDNVPKLRDLVTDPEGKKILQFIEVSEALGMGFWVHPDVPKDRLAALRKAFMDTMKDPRFLADAKKRKTPISPISGEKLMKIVAAGLDVSPALVTKMKSVFGFKKYSIRQVSPDRRNLPKMLRAVSFPCYRDASPPVFL